MGHRRLMTVVPNWNLKKDLGECIDSLLSSQVDQEIIVVDNASTDGSVEYIREKYPNVVLIALDENIGYAGALNAGIRYALGKGTDYVLCINSDTIFPAETIERLIQRMESDERIGVLTPKVLHYDHPEVVYTLGSKSFPWMPLPVEYGRRKPDQPGYRGFLEYDYVSACAIIVRASVFQAIGLFNEAFFMYYEDNDFCRRARDAGFRIGCDGDAVIFHKVSLSAKKQADRITYTRARNRVWFYRRYRHGPSPLLTMLVLLLVALWASIRNVLGGNMGWLRAYWRGFVEGWRTPFPEKAGVVL